MQIADRKDEGFYSVEKRVSILLECCHSCFQDEGKHRFEKLMTVDDKDIRWIIKENLKKDRLKTMDQKWTELTKQKIK